MVIYSYALQGGGDDFMGYFDSEKHVAEYLKMVEGYDGSALIEKVHAYLAEGSTLLELGMGPGTDLDMLRRYYEVTGSDSSQVFIDRYKSMHPEVAVLNLDAVTLDIDTKFDGIFSNKVLIHLTKKDCIRSLERQKSILNPKGFMFHTFWYGDKTEEYHRLLFSYYTENMLRNMFGKLYDIIKIKRYAEDKKDDSILVIAQKRS
jgi:trans-aconitate methyltransferase